MTRPVVSVVIPVKDGMEFLPALLDALLTQESHAEIEIVAVDSGSRDGTLDLLARHPVVVHEIPPREFNHGETRNLGIRLAKGDPVVLLTQDAIPAGSGFIESIVRPFTDPTVAGAYGRQIPRADCDVVTRRQLEAWLTGRPEPSVRRLDGGALDSLMPFDQYQLCNFDNVCSAVRRAVWERIPFPRVDFGEDIAWGKSVIAAGWAIAYEPAASVHHSHRRSVVYEFQRTRICHQVLGQLFGIATLPRRRDVVRACLANLRQEVPYVLRHAPNSTERIRQVCRVTGLSVVGPYAQYLGHRDAELG